MESNINTFLIYNVKYFKGLGNLSQKFGSDD